jgi:hypothetical protein
MPEVINVDHGSYHATITTIPHDDGTAVLFIRLELHAHRAAFSLAGYEAIHEFIGMLKKSAQLIERRAWDGRYFAAWSVHPEDAKREPTRAIGFRSKQGEDGVGFSLSLDEWRQLNELFDKALTMPEVQDLFEQFIS